MRTNDGYRKCPKCGADLVDDGSMFQAIYKCTECDYTDYITDAFCDLATSE